VVLVVVEEEVLVVEEVEEVEVVVEEVKQVVGEGLKGEQKL
jgi:hypothetical protein